LFHITINERMKRRFRIRVIMPMVDPEEMKDDIVRDLPEVIVSLCTRLYGKRSAKNENGAKRAIEAATGEWQHE